MAEQAHNPFDHLPIEINQHIGSFCSDTDLASYRQVCQSTHDAVEGDHCSFWFRRFTAEYEAPGFRLPIAGTRLAQNLKYKYAYQKRRKALRHGAKYDAALTRRQPREIKKGTEALEVLRDLIVDSFSEKKEADDDDAFSTVYDSKNIQHIKTFILNHDLLDLVFVPENNKNHRSTRASSDILCIPKPLLHTIQVLLAPAMFDLSRSFETYKFPTSQEVVYGTAAQHSPFGGCNNLDVNMDWVLHHLNFWKYHMCREAECTLFRSYSDLDADERPSFWSSQLRQGGGKLGSHWKGSYAFVDRDRIAEIRRGLGHENPVADEFNGEGTGTFQDMRLEFVDTEAVHWPLEFEQHLKALTPPASRAKTRAQRRSATPDGCCVKPPRSFQFTGEGHDVTEEFFAHGWLNALPCQQGVPGWQRMTMMKYFEDGESGEVDMEALWAYEGVVLPGGKIIVGRWWCPSDGTGESMYSGPFMLWCVDGPKYADEDAEEGVELDEDDLP